MSSAGPIEIFSDPPSTPAANPVKITRSSNPRAPTDRYCARYNSWSHKNNFIKRAKSSAIPLTELVNELVNDASEDSPRVKHNKQCNYCSSKRKLDQRENTRAKRTKLDNTKFQSLNRYSWEQVVQ